MISILETQEILNFTRFQTFLKSLLQKINQPADILSPAFSRVPLYDVQNILSFANRPLRTVP